MAEKIAVVTGANKGIGFAIVQGLCKKFKGIVYLTSRDETRGKNAVSELNNQGLHPRYHQLDVTDKKSVEVFRDYIKQTYGGFDVLVNNAAIAFKQDATEPAAVQAEETIRVNYFSLLQVSDILIPLLRNGGRVVNVSSAASHLSLIPSKSLRNQFKDENLTVPQLSELMNQYIKVTKEGSQEEEWGKSSYVVSKVGVTALTKIQQRLLNDRDIKVNAVHPGYVDTDMTSHKGPLTIEQGAEAPLFLALDAPDTLRGEFIWYDKSVVDWNDDTPRKLF